MSKSNKERNTIIERSDSPAPSTDDKSLSNTFDNDTHQRSSIKFVSQNKNINKTLRLVKTASQRERSRKLREMRGNGVKGLDRCMMEIAENPIKTPIDKCQRQVDIHVNSRRKNFELIEKEVKSNPRSVNYSDQRGWTPIFYLCYYIPLSLIPSPIDNRSRQLISSEVKEDEEQQIIAFLLKSGADPNISPIDNIDERKWTSPLFEAVMNGKSLAFICLMMMHGAIMKNTEITFLRFIFNRFKSHFKSNHETFKTFFRDNYTCIGGSLWDVFEDKTQSSLSRENGFHIDRTRRLRDSLSSHLQPDKHLEQWFQTLGKFITLTNKLQTISRVFRIALASHQQQDGKMTQRNRLILELTLHQIDPNMGRYLSCLREELMILKNTNNSSSVKDNLSKHRMLMKIFLNHLYLSVGSNNNNK